LKKSAFHSLNGTPHTRSEGGRYRSSVGKPTRRKASTEEGAEPRKKIQFNAITEETVADGKDPADRELYSFSLKKKRTVLQLPIDPQHNLGGVRREVLKNCSPGFGEREKPKENCFHKTIGKDPWQKKEGSVVEAPYWCSIYK